MRARLLLLSLLLLPLAALCYLCTQQPRLSLNAEQFGLILLRGGYRSWFLSFSDGKTYENGQWCSVVIDQDNHERFTTRSGYRLIPKCSHVSMPEFLRAHPEIKEFKP